MRREVISCDVCGKEHPKEEKGKSWFALYLKFAYEFADMEDLVDVCRECCGPLANTLDKIQFNKPVNPQKKIS